MTDIFQVCGPQCQSKEKKHTSLGMMRHSDKKQKKRRRKKEEKGICVRHYYNKGMCMIKNKKKKKNNLKVFEGEKNILAKFSKMPSTLGLALLGLSSIAWD